MTRPFAEIPIREEIYKTDQLTSNRPTYQLTVWNDDINTFDWVIQSLVEICGHYPEQAEQCALLIHHKGKYPVQTGEFKTLKSRCDAILERNIGATVEKIA